MHRLVCILHFLKAFADSHSAGVVSAVNHHGFWVLCLPQQLDESPWRFTNLLEVDLNLQFLKGLNIFWKLDLCLEGVASWINYRHYPLLLRALLCWHRYLSILILLLLLLLLWLRVQPQCLPFRLRFRNSITNRGVVVHLVVVSNLSSVGTHIVVWPIIIILSWLLLVVIV